MEVAGQKAKQDLASVGSWEWRQQGVNTERQDVTQARRKSYGDVNFCAFCEDAAASATRGYSIRRGCRQRNRSKCAELPGIGWPLSLWSEKGRGSRSSALGWCLKSRGTSFCDAAAVVACSSRLERLSSALRCHCAVRWSQRSAHGCRTVG